MSETHHDKNPERVMAGLKASIHNPSVSEEAKHHAKERLREMGEHEKNPERVIAGLKASIHNSAVSEEAKNHAKERLREMGVDPNDSASMSTEKSKVAIEEHSHQARLRGEHIHAEDDTEEHRMLGGYKATLKNPHTSQEAKEYARKVLTEHGALNE